MEKQKLTNKDVQRALIEDINKHKTLWVYLTVMLVLSLISCFVIAVKFPDIMVLGRHGNVGGKAYGPVVYLFILPLAELCFIIILLDKYYIDLYRAKTGRFTITEETLFKKSEEWVSYYRKSRMENMLCFRNFKIAVEKEVFSGADIGDRFCVVVLRAKKAPRLVYNKKDYEIEKAPKNYIK